MANDPRLERYLTTLESALKPFPVGDRAEIITEIRSHVLSALDRDPNASVDTILAALGEPEIVANRYLLERGMKPAKPPISPIVRWVVIGFLGTFAMVLLFAGFVIAQFSPIVKVDEKGNKVELLGGTIKVDGDEDRITIRSIIDGHSHVYAGSEPLQPGQDLAVRFKNGRVEVASAGDDSNLKFECKGSSPKSNSKDFWDGKSMLDLTDLGGVKCELQIPSYVKFKIEGENGNISIHEADFDTDADLTRGHLEFSAKEGSAFKFDVKVDMGKTDSFESSSDPKARQAKLHVGAGRISNEN